MIQKRVLLIHRDNDNYRNLTGWWSYPVPEFTWTSRRVKDGFKIDLTGTERDYDLVVLDDWIFGAIDNCNLPLAYVTVDSARSDEQLRKNIEQSRHADVILVDSDRLDKFTRRGSPVRRFAYAVNEHLYYPREKEYDVAFLCWPTTERRKIQSQCEWICKKYNWRFLSGTWSNYQDYARAIGSAKIVIHKSHVEQARSWRVFDVMASRGCLLTNPIPEVSGDMLETNKHYRVYNGEKSLEREICDLMDGEKWQEIAETGYNHVMANHVWSVRSKQLYDQLAEMFKW